MNDNWKFSDLPYTSPDVEALQARYDALTQRAKDAQDSEDLLDPFRAVMHLPFGFRNDKSRELFRLISVQWYT